MLSCHTMEKQSDVTDVYRMQVRMQVCEYVFVPQKLVVSSRRRSARGAEASATTPTRTSARTCSSTTRVRCSLLNRNRKLFVRLYRLARLDLLTLPASPAVCLVDAATCSCFPASRAPATDNRSISVAGVEAQRAASML